MGDSEKQEATGNRDGGGEGKEEDMCMSMEGMAVLDFDMLCATVALQTQGYSVGKGGKLEGRDEGDEEEEEEFGGVQRMWEGGVLDCFEDRWIALESGCCPCYRFGKNMRRAGFGSCFLQGTIYFILSGIALLNYVAYGVTNWHSFLYLAVAFTMTLGIYMGLFRTQIRKQFNIRGSNSSIDDCMSHLFCPCCTLCQESRTLEINNVLDGVWRGRGDTICIGSYGEGTKAFFELHQPSVILTESPKFCSMERSINSDEHSWNADASQSEPLVSPSQ